MAHTALRLVLMAYLCCLCLSQGPEVLLLGSVREAVGEIKALSERFTEVKAGLELLQSSQNGLQMQIQELQGGLELLTESQNGVKEKVGELQGGLELLTESQNGVKEKVGELHERMTSMEGHLVGLQGSSKQDSLLEVFMRVLQSERDFQKDSLNRTCSVAEKITELQNNFSTEFQRVEESVQKCSSGEQLSNFQVLLKTDECADGTHRCSPNAACEDALIQYTCTCLLGYNGDGFSCEDVDECSKETHRCHTNGKCHNGMGSYTCTCDPGFSGDGFNCEDVDECSTEAHRCHTNGKCHNGMGSYTCTCDPGFSGDGFNCEAVPCESPSRFFETLGCVTPVTRPMRWEAAKRNCQDMGGRLLEKISSQSELDQLKEQVNGLYTDYAWVGIYRWNWNETGDPIHPSSLWDTGEPDRRDTEEYGCVGVHRSLPRLADCYSSASIGSLCQTAFPRG